ncbi:hypothetical protein H8D57_01625, partial [bacterium]|nr:hypothetical protein [bacterium]
ADTIVAWFENDCYRPNQVKAFRTITEYEAGTMYAVMRTIKVKTEYDIQAIKTAFEGFVRSITLDYDTLMCAEYVTDPAIWDYQFNIYHDADGWPGMGSQFLSVFHQWGFADLYPIAVELSYNEDIDYTVFIWNELGVGFFEYLENEVNTKEHSKFGFASTYLRYFDNPSPEMVAACVNVLQAAAISPYTYNRAVSAAMIVKLYAKGFDQFRNNIITLQNDAELRVRQATNRKIKWEQKYGRMIDFQVPAAGQ